MEALEAIPEPDGVTLHRMPPFLDPPGELIVEVACCGGTLDVLQQRRERALQPQAVALDLAHDLSWQGPHAWIWPEAGGHLGVTRWGISVLGFIEDEAWQAFEAVCNAIDGKL